MKSRIKLILAFVLSMLMVFAFAGCANMAGGSEDGGGESGDTDLIYDFEQWMPNFSGIHISDKFGRITLNTDKTYVTHGSGSAKLEPEGNGWMYIQTMSDFFDYDHSDFTNVRAVQVELYNATSEPMNVVMGFVTQVIYYDSFDRIGDTNFLLSPGWNTVTLDFPADIICYMADVTSIEGISFSFPSGVDSLGNQAVFYLDEVRLLPSATPNASTPDAFPYDFAGYAEQGKLVAFEDEYADQFFIHEKETDMAIVNALSEKNGQGDALGLPDESRPEDDWVFKIEVDTTSGWTESGGLNGKLLRDALSRFDADVLNAPGARIRYRIYATSDYPETEVNCLLANFRLHTSESYANRYNRGGEYFLFNSWYEFDIPLAAILGDSNYSDVATPSGLVTALDSITLYTASYYRVGATSSTYNVPYTLYLSDFYLEVPEQYDVVKDKLVNFQTDGVTEYIRPNRATAVSVVDSTVEQNAEGIVIGAPYADDVAFADRAPGAKVLKVEVPNGVPDTEEVFSIYSEPIRFALAQYEDNELDKNATVTVKVYMTGGTGAANFQMKAWYNSTGGKANMFQENKPLNTWQTFTFPLSKIMDNSSFACSAVGDLPNKVLRLTFGGPGVSTIYVSDIYITPAA